MADVRYTRAPLKLTIDEAHTVELPAQVLRFRMKGLMFDTDKTFLLPSAMQGIRQLVEVYDQHTSPSLAITGHSDRVGEPAYNLRLSDARAQAIAHFLRDEASAWLRGYDDQPHAKPWGALEDQHMLAAITDAETEAPFYEGTVDGFFGAASTAAAKRFQSSRGLSVDGIPGPQTREALITDYMALDGTSLPETAEVDLLGCGEHHNAVPTDDGVDEPENRRVEIFLFDPGPATPACPETCPGDGCAYEGWLADTVKTIDFEDSMPEADWGLLAFEVSAVDDDPKHGSNDLEAAS